MAPPFATLDYYDTHNTTDIFNDSLLDKFAYFTISTQFIGNRRLAADGAQWGFVWLNFTHKRDCVSANWMYLLDRTPWGWEYAQQCHVHRTIVFDGRESNASDTLGWCSPDLSFRINDSILQYLDHARIHCMSAQ